MRRALLLAPLAFLLLIMACPRPRDDDGDPNEPADGDSDGRPPAWIPVVPATEALAPETAPDPKPVPAEDVEAPAGAE